MVFLGLASRQAALRHRSEQNCWFFRFGRNATPQDGHGLLGSSSFGFAARCNVVPRFLDGLEHLIRLDPVANLTRSHEVGVRVIGRVRERHEMIPPNQHPCVLSLAKNHRAELGIAVQASVVLTPQRSSALLGGRNAALELRLANSLPPARNCFARKVATLRDPVNHDSPLVTPRTGNPHQTDVAVNGQMRRTIVHVSQYTRKRCQRIVGVVQRIYGVREDRRPRCGCKFTLKAPK